MVKVYDILFIVLIFVGSDLSAQGLRIDVDFGNNGRVELKHIHNVFTKLFYDKNYNSIYVCYSYDEEGEYSKQNFYTDGIFKIDLQTGDLDTKFGSGGEVFHTVESYNRDNGSVYWHSTDENIVCINRTSKDKEILIYSKSDGNLWSFIKPDSHKILYSHFSYYDIKWNRFLLTNEKSIGWYDENAYQEQQEISKFIDSQARSIGCLTLSFEPDSMILLVKENFGGTISDSLQYKVMSIVRDTVTLLHTFQSSENGITIQFDNGEFARIGYADYPIHYNMTLFSKSGECSRLELPATFGDYFRIIDHSNEVFYGLDELYEFAHLKEGENIPLRIVKDYLLIIIKGGNEINEYSISSILPNNLQIESVKHIGNNEFLVLSEEKKRSRRNKYLYKLVLD